MKLSGAQRDAITRTGQDVCCAAGPGSGKTRVLVERVVWLVDQGKDPARILAITFTEKAAKEIKRRLVERFQGRRELRESIERTPVSTIHSFCRSLLAEHALRCGLDPSFRVLDEREARSEQHAALRAVLDRAAVERRDQFRALIHGWSETEPLGAIAALYEKHRALLSPGGPGLAPRSFDPESRIHLLLREVGEMLDQNPRTSTPAAARRVEKLRAWLDGSQREDRLAWLEELGKVDLRGLRPGDVIYDAMQRIRLQVQQARAEVIGSIFESERESLVSILAEFDAEYRRRKRKLGVADFGDLEEFALSLLRNDAGIKREVQERYEAILMDELQDTNPIQWSIVNELRRPAGFFAVGDINQSIYGFRGAEPLLFEGYERSLNDAKLVIDRLEENYRSRGPILAAVEKILPDSPGLRMHRLTPAREFDAADGICVELMRVEDGDESLWVARRIRELIAEGPFHRYSDYAILARSATGFDSLEAALERFGIPCVLHRGRNFFEEPEIVDLTNCLRVLVNPSDHVALLAILRSPFFGIADEEIYRLRLEGRDAPQWAAARIEALRSSRGERAADEILAELLDETGYLAGRSARVEANIRKFLQLLRQLEISQALDLAACLEQVEEIGASGRETNAPAAGAVDAVQVMSIHGAKGLEFPVVFLTSIDRGAGAFPPSLNCSANLGLGVRWRAPGGSETIADPVYEENRLKESQREALEEDRLLYVAMTRAEQRLVITWNHRSSRQGAWAKRIESVLEPRWPDELGKPAVEGHIRLLRVSGAPPGEFAETPAQGEEIITLETLPPALQPPSSAAPTTLVEFTECPRRYFLSRLIGWPQPQQGAAATLGTEVHRILAGESSPADSEEARELASAFDRSALGQRAAKADRVEREFDFLVEQFGLLVRGSIDLWFEDAEGCTLVDYKSDRSLPPVKLAGYRAQLEHYALMLERLRGRPVDEAFLFLLREGKAVRIDLGKDVAAQCAQRIGSFLEAHRSGEFPLNAGERCRYCPYWNRACPGLAI
jgi:ATP-dependent exoDNAse (exonuclease V) beta subunit